MKNYLEQFATYLDNTLFHEDQDVESYDFLLFVNYFNHDYSAPLHFLKYLKKEVKSSLILNTVLASLNFVFLPFRWSHYWDCSPCVTIWFSVLSLLNWIIIWPKLMILFRINRVVSVEDNSACGYLIWALFRSKLYKLNNKVSKYIFGTYAAGIILYFFKNTCSDLSWSMLFLLVFFMVRLFLSFYKFNKTFANFHNIELLFEYLRANNAEKIQALKLIGYKELIDCTKDSAVSTCAICYEDYIESSIMRVMKCPGQHVFHKRCIDRWLVKSDKCPMCNCSVFYTVELGTKTD